MDLLLLHVPKFNNYYKPIGNFSFIELPPIGLLGLADFVRSHHRTTKIIHLGVERQVAGSIDLDKIIAEQQPAMIGLDLHWHFQAFDVIETAKKIKRARPEIAVLLGGFTASFFAEEILRNFDCVDFIIRGDAEVPLVKLLQHHLGDQIYDEVPNLAFRNGTVRMNPINYVADRETLDSICYTDFTLMKDYPVFVSSFSRYMSLNGLSQPSQRRLFHWKKSYPLMLGRGCFYRCSYCGGSSTAQKIINNRTRVCYRSVEPVLESLADLQRFGFEFAHVPFDPMPPEEADEFYLPFFEGIVERGIPLPMEVERYCIPSRRFIRAFRTIPGSDESFVTLSVHSQSEELRRKNQLYRYSNEELENGLSVMEEEGVNCVVFFTCGLPFETEDDLRGMAEYQAKLRKKFSRVRCKTSMIEIEPCSELSQHPDHYQLVPRRMSFADYYRYHSCPSRNHFLEMGYDRVGCPDCQSVSHFFCDHFCSHFRTGRIPPLACKALCGVAGAMWRLRMFTALDKVVSQWQHEDPGQA